MADNVKIDISNTPQFNAELPFCNSAPHPEMARNLDMDEPCRVY